MSCKVTEFHSFKACQSLQSVDWFQSNKEFDFTYLLPRYSIPNPLSPLLNSWDAYLKPGKLLAEFSTSWLNI